MKGVMWCLALAGASLVLALLALLGLVVDSERLMAWGGGAIATAVVGWPVLLVVGAVHTSGRRKA